ncbi:hypothetical protein LTR81_026495 [Elasticomyces elasticus]
MPVEVLEADDGDMERLFEICSLAFNTNEPLWEIFWPKYLLDSGRKQGAERMRETRRTDPSTKYMKAVDEAGTIMGMAKWNIHDSKAAKTDVPKVANYWDQGEDLEYSTVISEIFSVKRNEAIRRTGGNVVILDICVVDPAYQRKGVGHALVNWGTAKADELGIEATVESLFATRTALKEDR